MSIPPKSLKNALIFYITCIIVFTNGFFAVLTISRENLNAYLDNQNKSFFLGQILHDPAMDFLSTGSSGALDRILANRASGFSEIKVTLYDANWWARWGDAPRIPSEGFPGFSELNGVAFRNGISGLSSREIFFPLASEGKFLGAIGVGLPEVASTKALESFFHVLVGMLVNIFLGVTLAIFISQIILRPLANLLEGLEAVKGGDFGQRIQITEGEEMVMIGEMFNLMASSLQEKIKDELERTRVLEEKVQELWEIYELTKEMGFNLNLKEILRRFQEKAQTLSFSSYCQILLVNPQTGDLETEVESPSFPRISRIEYETNLALCLSGGETIQIQSQHHTLLFLPLLAGRLVKGILFLGKQGKQNYSEGVRRFLETIAPLGGSLVENAQLYHHVVEMKDYVRNVLESVDSGVVTLDLEDRVVTVNAALQRILDIKTEIPRGQPVSGLLDGLGDQRFKRGFLEIIASPIPMPAEAMVVADGERPDGGIEGSSGQNGEVHKVLEMTALHQLSLQLPGRPQRILQIRLGPLLAGKAVIGKVVIIEDQTTIKQIERKMLESEKWAVLGRLAASVAHEIRNPLVAIRSLVEIIGDQAKGEEEKEHVKVVVGEVNRLNKVVEQLLNLSRPEKTDLQKVSLTDLLEKLILLVRHEASRHRVEIRKDWPATPVLVTIDPEKIRQAFLNVILNAFHAMEKGGRLDVVVNVSNYGAFPGNPERPNGVCVAFKDCGCGIQPEVIDRIFEPFFTTRPTGTGVGLAITKKVVDLHHGRIDIETEVGKGTCFRIILPLSDSPAPEKQES